MFRRRDPRHVAMLASLLVSLLMLAGKLGAYALTGSTAIFADAAESVIHIFATAFVGFSLWYAVQPADAGHPYGHGKIAYFAAGMEGMLILVAAVGIFVAAGEALVERAPLERLDAGLGLLAVLTVVNFGLGRYLVTVGRRHNALVLVSNGQHVLTDMWTSVGVLVGVAGVRLTGLLWLDAAVAALVALHILWAAFGLLRRAARGLMEHADEADTDAIRAVLDDAVRDGRISGYHQLRHRRVNDQLWVEYHVLLPNALTIEAAHERAHGVEETIGARFPEDTVTVTAHLEPETHDDAHPAGHAEPVDPFLTG